MDETELRERLGESFDATQAEIDVVVRAAKRVDRAGVWEDVIGEPLTAESLIDNLDIADRSLVVSWNWWLGTNGYAHQEDCERFQI